MIDRIRWGILSTANIGRRVIPAIHASSNGEVTAVGSRSLAAAQAFAKEQNIPTAYGSYEELIADEGVDAIYISLPNRLHAEWSIKCAKAGKATLCEKPFASDAQEARTVVDVFGQAGVLLAEAFMYRFHPQQVKVKEIIAAGGIGDLHIISSSFTYPIHGEGNIRLSKALAGGGLMDIGCYCINLMRFITGEEPVSVTAAARIGQVTGVDEALAATLEFPSGVIGHFDCGLRSQRQQTYTVKGSEGMIVVPTAFTPDKVAGSCIQHWQGNSCAEHSIAAADHYQLMVEDFADALLNRREPRFSPMDAVRNMEVIDRILAQAG